MAAAKKTKRVQLVEIVWDDITGHGPNWKEQNEIDQCGPTRCKTLGYLWSKGKNWKVIGTITEDGGLSDINVIPKGVIREVKVWRTIDVEVVK